MVALLQRRSSQDSGLGSSLLVEPTGSVVAKYGPTPSVSVTSSTASSSLSVGLKTATAAIVVLGVLCILGICVLLHFNRCKRRNCPFCHFMSFRKANGAKRGDPNTPAPTVRFGRKAENVSVHSALRPKRPSMHSEESFDLEHSPIGFYFPIELNKKKADHHAPYLQTLKARTPEYLSSPSIRSKTASITLSNAMFGSHVSQGPQLKPSKLSFTYEDEYDEEKDITSPTATNRNSDNLSFITLPSFVGHDRSHSASSTRLSAVPFTPRFSSSKRFTWWNHSDSTAVPPVPSIDPNMVPPPPGDASSHVASQKKQSTKPVYPKVLMQKFGFSRRGSLEDYIDMDAPSNGEKPIERTGQPPSHNTDPPEWETFLPISPPPSKSELTINTKFGNSTTRASLTPSIHGRSFSESTVTHLENQYAPSLNQTTELLYMQPADRILAMPDTQGWFDNSSQMTLTRSLTVSTVASYSAFPLPPAFPRMSTIYGTSEERLGSSSLTANTSTMRPLPAAPSSMAVGGSRDSYSTGPSPSRSRSSTIHSMSRALPVAPMLLMHNPSSG